VKLFLKKPDQSQGLVQKVLQAATAENDNPDIRDRAYVYWRLLSSDPQVAKVSAPACKYIGGLLMYPDNRTVRQAGHHLDHKVSTSTTTRATPY